MPSRRQFLGTTATTIVGTVVTAGCVTAPADTGNPDGERGTSTTPTRTRSTRPSTPPSEGDVVVEDIVVRKAITYTSTMGSGGVLAADGQQYVVASVRTREELPESASTFRTDPHPESAFTFRTDGQSWTPGLPETVGGLNYAVSGHDGGAVGQPVGEGRSYLAFTVPSPLPVSNPRIELAANETTAWPLPTTARERLAAPAPQFELTELVVPETVSRGATLSVSLTAENVSETDGRFLAALYWPTRVADDNESHVVEREVDAGDDVTSSLEIGTVDTPFEENPVTLAVRGHVTAEREVELRETETRS